ncbi:MAG: MarR family transcriptional regulator [Ascidiaceihabitans sp.]|uniref:MarR family winged helix-turn-helix transcriptional regulator n=1 Tax=Rhodobacterales TaxID=204455 RepID=UPI003299139F
MTQELRIRELLTRLARLDATESWSDDVNPAQRSVLDYLTQANRFSRSPSHVADYLGSTRGTVSQTLKSLSAKGYVTERRSSTDKRVVQYQITEKGEALVAQPLRLIGGIEGLDGQQLTSLETTLRQTLRSILDQNDGKPFGLCRDCRHFQKNEGQSFCQLLSEHLTPQETDLICHEQDPA